MNNSLISCIHLPELAVIEISGEDAVSFLHGQLTQDVEGLQQGQARLAAYCTAKGRVLATLVFWKEGACLRAMLRSDLAETFVRRLSMFVLRAKVRLRVEPVAVLGRLSDGNEGAGTEPWSVTVSDDFVDIATPSASAGKVRWWRVPRLGLEQPSDTPPATSAEQAAAWQAADIAAGLPWVQAATQDMFIPQTLNLDLIGGVNFTKGCYPGQEVVARAHYRGAVKRRMAYGVVRQAASHAGTDPGSDTYDARHPDTPCGRIVNTSMAGDTIHVLMEVRLADLGEADFRLDGPEGPAIQDVALPDGVDAD
ncbi:folate-binding protein [Allopusillimonas soli]|uniref:Folate-binding protein YgfZ n=1 Tax=Allopusillimonas soli TaxID=659016 RepID=A0A853FFA7_9BURK|nr:folate-binding protein YgfZ [Allopusillimonas soli]NYT36706.1 folate-binding protein YgfZ [Allopusillimonas soli]TEA75183.1 folate-binding protein [Allopusillimonas soli]